MDKDSKLITEAYLSMREAKTNAAKERKREKYYQKTDVADMSPTNAMRAQFPYGSRVNAIGHGVGKVVDYKPKSREIAVKFPDGKTYWFDVNEVMDVETLNYIKKHG